MKAKRNFRSILVVVLTIMMLTFAICAVACNKNDKPNENSSNSSSSQVTQNSSSVENSSSTGGGNTSSSGGSTDNGTKPNTDIGANDALTVLEGYKEVKASLNLNEFSEQTGKVTADVNKGVFTIQEGAEIRSRTKEWSGATSYTAYSYVNLHKTLDGKTAVGKEILTYSMKLANGKGLKVSVPGDGYLSLYVQNGSSGADEQIITINGTQYKFPGNNFTSPVVQISINVTKGDYIIGRPSGTVDLFMAELHCVAVDSPATGIAVATMPQINFLAGQEFSANGLVVGLNYEDGTQEALLEDAYTVDYSAVDMTKSGEYNVNIVYKANDKFNCAYTVKVNELDRVEVGTYATEKVANSSAGNGVYYNQSVKTCYAVGEKLDTNYITVNAYDKDGTLYSFKNDSQFLTYTVKGEEFNSAFYGNYVVDVTLTLNGVAKLGSYNVSVVAESLAVTDGTVYIKVDSTFAYSNGGVTRVGEIYCNTFNTIGMAFEYLKAQKANIGTKPIIMNIVAGTYKEKLEIEIPNLTIKGLGAKPEDTLIEWDSLYGVKDASGYPQVTDSTQSVAVRETAVNCTIQNLTISNYWNSVERFNERADKDSCDHRALALLVQSDKFIMDNCRLLGYQDTVEFFYGRQLIKNSYVQGTTDFIFGSNNTTYFYNCEIKSTEHVKGTPGYITAMKGCSSGAGDSVLYGVIFDHCNFTAEVGVANTAIGRCWGNYSAVAVINSTMGAHISTKPSTGASSGERYVAMTAKPTDATVKFVEYNNTGAGAITETVAGMTYLDATTAANYSNLAVIFGTTNGAVTYADAWTPSL